MSIDESALLESLATVIDPNTNEDFVSTGQLTNLRLDDGDVSFQVQLHYPARSQLAGLRRALIKAARQVPGVENVSAELATRIEAHAAPRGIELLAQVKHIVAIASGKGGVGKSTTAVNLALALAAEGAAVGLLDADIYGPSQPMMMGVSGRPESFDDGKTIEPKENYGVQVMSIGFMVDADDPMIWRGPMAVQALEQLLRQTHWRALDYLVLDLPPGTGDIPLTLSQRAPISGVVIVTTPQDIALLDARKGLRMFEKVGVPILGIVENMALHVCGQCGHAEAIFGTGGGSQLAAEGHVPHLGSLPLDLAIRVDADGGRPTVVSDPDSDIAARYRHIARQLAIRISLRQRAITGRASFPTLTISPDT